MSRRVVQVGGGRRDRERREGSSFAILLPPLSSLLLVILCTCTVLLGGCEEDVNPVLGTDQAFTLYGYFNPRSNEQAVRVFTIDGQLEHIRPEPIDAVVTSTDLQTGEQVAWADSIVQFRSGRYGHVFGANFQAEYEHRYRLEVARSDGVVATVEATVPPLSEAEIGEANPNDFDLLFPVLWRDAPNLIDIRVIYRTSVGIFEQFYGVESEQVEGGRQVIVQFKRDTRPIFLEAFIRGESDVFISEMEMQVFVANEEWTPPGGVFDPDALVEPGVFSNVENGFGFVGGGYPTSVTWLPSDAVLRAAGFTLE